MSRTHVLMIVESLSSASTGRDRDHCSSISVFESTMRNRSWITEGRVQHRQVATDRRGGEAVGFLGAAPGCVARPQIPCGHAVEVPAQTRDNRLVLQFGCPTAPSRRRSHSAASTLDRAVAFGKPRSRYAHPPMPCLEGCRTLPGLTRKEAATTSVAAHLVHSPFVNCAPGSERISSSPNRAQRGRVAGR